MMTPSHVVVVDYRNARLSQLANLFASYGITVHNCVDRLDAIRILASLASQHLPVHAVLSSWLVEPPRARRFYALVGDEVAHTSLSLFTSTLILMPQTAATMLTYTDRPKEAYDTLKRGGLSKEVAVCDTTVCNTKNMVEKVVLGSKQDVMTYYSNKATASYRKDETTDCLSGMSL